MRKFGEQLEWLDGRREEMAALVAELAGVSSGSYDCAGLAKLAAGLKHWLSERGFVVREIALPPQRLIADDGSIQERPLGKALAFSGTVTTGPRVLMGIHYDTVFGPDNPFEKVTRDADFLRGPGVCDAKGGLVVMLYALLAFLRSPVAGKLSWEVLLNPDEEIGSPGSAPLWIEAARRRNVALLFEPALHDGALVSARKGSGNFTIIVRGRAAHAGRDAAMGRNAIHALAGLITRIAAMQNEIHGISVNTGFIHGGGPVNIVPDFAITRINIRVETQEQRTCVEERLAEIVHAGVSDGIAVEMHGGFHSPPKMPTPETEIMLQSIAACGKEIDLDLTWRPTGGACDGNRIAAAGIPTIDSVGPRGGGMHTNQEFIDVASLPERAKLVALYLMKLAEGST